MNVTPLALSGLLTIEPLVHADDRGFFLESFNKRAFEEAIGRSVDFVQDNHSQSRRHVLRGLHFQRPPHEQGKLVRVVRGEILDVAVDIRPSSPTFLQWISVRLSADNGRQLWIPEGFAHGFHVITEEAEVLYKATDYYAPSAERSIRWNDPRLGIDWELQDEPLLSPKDAAAPLIDAAGTLS